MEIWNTISANAFDISIMMIALLIPVLLILLVVRVLGGATKKTVRSLKK
jgi:hypothetical protein